MLLGCGRNDPYCDPIQRPEVEFAGGTGISSDPFLIASGIHMNQVRYSPDSYFKIINDIVLTGQWAPIPNFTGVLDGDDFTISNMRHHATISGSLNTTVRLGLFQSLSGVAKNFTLANSSIIIGSNHRGSGWIDAGLVAGNLAPTGIIENVMVVGASRVEIHRHQSRIAAIVGTSSGTVRNCTVIGTEVRGNGDSAGIIGGMFGGSVDNNSVSNLYIWHHRTGADRGIGLVVGFSDNGHLRDNIAMYSRIHRDNIGGRFGVLAGNHINRPGRIVNGNSWSGITQRMPNGATQNMNNQFG